MSTLTSVDKYRNIILASKQGGLVDAAHEFCKDNQLNCPVQIYEHAVQFWREIAQEILNHGKYLTCAKLLWDKDTFQTEPESTQQVFKTISNNSKTIILGAGGMSKSYSMSGWGLLDYFRDPADTEINLLSSSGEHAEGNIFASMVDLFEKSAIPMPGTVFSQSIVFDEKDKHNGVRVMSIPEKNKGKGKIRGGAPRPRRAVHPVFIRSRIRYLIDECEFLLDGAWEDLDNILLKKFDEEHLKVIGATNPFDRLSACLQRAEPIGGWHECGARYEWKSRLGWAILQLDAEQSENVKTGKVIYPGFQTREGLENMAMSYGGKDSPLYFTFCRGFPPKQGGADKAIPEEFIARSKGEFNFISDLDGGWSFDPSGKGNDRFIGTQVQWGIANGWKDVSGVFHQLPKPQPAVQFHQQVEITKKEVIEQAEAICALIDQSGYKRKNVCLDASGNASGLFSILQRPEYCGPDIIGVDSSGSCTDMKVMDDDLQNASELYYKVESEIVFALRRYLEHGYAMFGPQLWSDSELFKEMRERKAVLVGKKQKVEPKKDYRKRVGKRSPDKADSAGLGVHLARLRLKKAPAMLNAVKRTNQNQQRPNGDKKRKMCGYVDRKNYLY